MPKFEPSKMFTGITLDAYLLSIGQQVHEFRAVPVKFEGCYTVPNPTSEENNVFTMFRYEIPSDASFVIYQKSQPLLFEKRGEMFPQVFVAYDGVAYIDKKTP